MEVFSGAARLAIVPPLSMVHIRSIRFKKSKLTGLVHSWNEGTRA